MEYEILLVNSTGNFNQEFDTFHSEKNGKKKANPNEVNGK